MSKTLTFTGAWQRLTGREVWGTPLDTLNYDDLGCKAAAKIIAVLQRTLRGCLKCRFSAFSQI